METHKKLKTEKYIYFTEIFSDYASEELFEITMFPEYISITRPENIFPRHRI